MRAGLFAHCLLMLQKFEELKQKLEAEKHSQRAQEQNMRAQEQNMRAQEVVRFLCSGIISDQSDTV